MKRLNIVFLLILAALMLVSCGEIFELEELTVSDPKTLLTAKLLMRSSPTKAIAATYDCKLNGVLEDGTTDFGSLSLRGEFKCADYDKSSLSKSVSSKYYTLTLNFNDFWNDTSHQLVSDAFAVLSKIKLANNISADEFTYHSFADSEPYLTWGKTKLSEGIEAISKFAEALTKIIVDKEYTNLDTSVAFTNEVEFEDADGIPYEGTSTINLEFEKGSSFKASKAIFLFLKKITVEANVNTESVQSGEASPALEEVKALSDFSLVYDVKDEVLVYNRVNKYSLPFMSFLKLFLDLN